MTTVICRTAGCINEGVPIDVGERPTTDPDGEPYDGPWVIVCGPCGQTISSEE